MLAPMAAFLKSLLFQYADGTLEQDRRICAFYQELSLMAL